MKKSQIEERLIRRIRRLTKQQQESVAVYIDQLVVPPQRSSQCANNHEPIDDDEAGAQGFVEDW